MALDAKKVLAISQDYTDQQVSGKLSPVCYDGYSGLVTDLNTKAKQALHVGQNIYIKTTDVPDLWIYSNNESTSVPYSYTTDAAFIAALESTGVLQIGYYKVAKLEGGTKDFNDLENRPKYNGVVMTGSTDIPKNPKISTSTEGLEAGDYWEDGVDSPLIAIVDDNVTQNSSHVVKSSGIYAALQAKITNPSGGSAGNVLKKTANGETWGSVTAEEATYDSTLTTHTTGSVGAALVSQSEQIVTLDAKLTSKSASSSDVGKFAKISSVVDGKITGWEFGEAGGGGGGDVDYLTVVNGELCIKYTEV